MKCFNLSTILFKKTIACLLLLLLFSCRDQGCTEADDFGEFTTNNLQFPQYTNSASLNTNKSLCNDYNKLKLNTTSVEACVNDNGNSITKNCATSVTGEDSNCRINFQSECSSASYAEFHKACFAKYASRQTSQGGNNYVIAKNDTNNPNFYLVPKADVSVKIRGEISIQRAAGGDIGKIAINKANTIVQNNSFAVQNGQVLQIFLSNNSGSFFDFSAISGNLTGGACQEVSGGGDRPLWQGNFLNQACLSNFQSAQQSINNNYSTATSASYTIQDVLKKIIVYKTPYVENTKATAPSPENWGCYDANNVATCTTTQDSEDSKSDALKIDNQSSTNKRKLGVGFVLATNETITSPSVSNDQSLTLNRQENLVEYYKTGANCSGFTITRSNTPVTDILSAGTSYVFATTSPPPQTCTLLPMLSVKQEISGWVEIGFIKVGGSTTLPSVATISIVNANGDFETFSNLNSKTINLKNCTNESSVGSLKKCTSFSSPNSASVFVRKGQTLLVRTDADSMTIPKIKQFGLFVKTHPSPAIYCPSNKFRMQRNVLCSEESGSDSAGFCKIGPEKCQIIPSQEVCQCANNADFRREWFSKFQLATGSDSYQLTTNSLSSSSNCNAANIVNCNACLSAIGSLSQKKLYSSSYETVCFDLERYQGKTSVAKSELDGLNGSDDLNAIQLAEELPENITILPYFSAEKNYGILSKPRLSAFPTDVSNPTTADQKLQLESTINSNSAGKIAVFFADNSDILNGTRAMCSANCLFNIASNSSLTLRDGEGLKISLLKNRGEASSRMISLVSYEYGTLACHILLNNKSPNCPDLYTLKSGNLMRNSTPYDSSPYNICRKGDTLHPLASAYQEIFCYDGAEGVFVENNPQQTKINAEHVSLAFELDTENSNIFFKNCNINDSGTHSTDCQASQCSAGSAADCRQCNAMKIINPNFSGSTPNTNIGSGADNYYTCIREDGIVKAVAGSYNISVAVKNEKDIIDYIDIILTPILDLLYSGEKDCSIPLREGQPTNVTPSYCEQNSNNCNGKTYIVSDGKYIPFSQSSPPALYCSMAIDNKNEITNANVSSSPNCAQCRPVRIGEIERIYEVILNSNNFSNAVRISTVLMVMFYGLTYLMGVSKLNQVEMVNRVFKVAVVGLFLDPQSGWLWFNTLIVQPFNNGADYLSFLFASVLESSESKDLITALNNGDYSNKSLLFSTTNDIINLFLQDETWKKVGALFFFDLFGPIYALGIFYIIWIYVFVVANVLLVYVVAKLLMGVLFLVGPVFIVFFLFEKTQDYFKKWINTILSYAFQQFFVIFTLNFFNMLIYHLIKLVLGFKVCWDEVWNINLGLMNFTLLEFWTPYSNPLPPKLGGNPSLYQSAVGVPTVSAILCLYAIVHIMKNFMPQIAELANAITEGAYNAANGGSLIGKSMQSIYQSGKQLFLNSYPVKTAINKAKSVAYKGLDKYLGIGPEAERKKEKAMKHRKEMLGDRDSISATANKKLAEFKTQHAFEFATGKMNADTLKTARADFLKEAAKEKELERGLKILGISKSEYNKLQGKKKDEIEKRARFQAKKAGFSQDNYLNDKGLSIKDMRNHSSLAGLAFTGFKEVSHKGGTLTKSLNEKNNNQKFDPRISRRDLENIRRSSPELLKEINMKNVRENSFYEHSQQAQDFIAHFASKTAVSFKNDVFNPSMNYMAGAMKSSGAFGAASVIGGGFAGAFGGATGLLGAGAVLAGAGIFGALGGAIRVAASPVGWALGGIYGALTGKGFTQGARDGKSYMFKTAENQFALSKFLFYSSGGMAKHFGGHGLSSARKVGVGAASGVGILVGGVAGATAGGVHGFFLGGAQGGISAYAKSTKDSRLSAGFAGLVGVAGGAVGGAVAGVRIGAVSGASIVNNLKNKPSVSEITNNIMKEATGNNRRIGDIGEKSADIGFAGARGAFAGASAGARGAFAGASAGARSAFAAISYARGGTVGRDIKSALSSAYKNRNSAVAGASVGATDDALLSFSFRDTVRNSIGDGPIRLASSITDAASLVLAAPPVQVPLALLAGGIVGAVGGAVGFYQFSRSYGQRGGLIAGAVSGAQSGYNFIAGPESPIYAGRFAPQKDGEGGEGSSVGDNQGGASGICNTSGLAQGDYGEGEQDRYDARVASAAADASAERDD